MRYESAEACRVGITQVNHVLSNFRMMQLCIVSMQVATCAMIVVYQAQNSASKNGEVVKTWHQGVKGVKGDKVQREKSWIKKERLSVYRYVAFNGAKGKLLF